jgi:V8-like Glu-specific endopeptidase
VGFRDQVLCTRYTSGGDSGAAVLNKRRYLVGLHFAGSASASVFNPVRHVFRALDIKLA